VSTLLITLEDWSSPSSCGWRPDPRGGSTQEAAGTTDSRATAEITALCFSTPTPALTSTIQGSEEGAKTTALVPGPPTSIARRRAKLRRDLKVARTYPQAGRRVALDGSWDHHPPLGVAHGGSAGRGGRVHHTAIPLANPALRRSSGCPLVAQGVGSPLKGGHVQAEARAVLS